MASLNLIERANLINQQYDLNGKDAIQSHHIRDHFKVKGIKYKQINVVTAYRRRPNLTAEF